MEIDRIDALRGLLCTAIFVFHYMHGSPMGTSALYQFLRKTADQGTYAVQVFFALSGLLIFNSYSRSIFLKEKNRRLTFYLKRIFRIYPAWGVALLGFAYYYHADLTTYFWNFFFLFGLKPFRFEEILALHAWTLYVEEMFYILFPFLIFIYRKGWTIYAYVLFLLLEVVTKAAPLYSNGHFYYNPFNTFEFFFWGMLAYFFLPQLRKIRVSRILFYLCLAGVVLMSCTYTTALLIEAYVVFSFLILFAAPKEFSDVFLFLFRSTGRLCYSFYLVHPLAVIVAIKIFPFSTEQVTDPTGISFFAHFFVTYLTVYGLAIPLYFFVERPFIDLGKKWTARLSERF